MIGDIYCVGNKMYSTKYTYNFNSYTELDFSDTETITYNGFTSKRMILRNGNSSVTTHIYGNDTWIINSTPQFVTYANGPRPLFVRNENQALPMKGDKITIVGSRITGSTLIAVDKSDSTLEITQTTLTSGKISATVMFTTNPTTDLPIFLD